MEVTEELGPAEGIEVGCHDIGELFEDGRDQIEGTAFFVKGFVEIETQSEVEVVGVYTVAGGAGSGVRGGAAIGADSVDIEPHPIADEEDGAN